MSEFTSHERKTIYDFCKRLKKEYGYKVLKNRGTWWHYIRVNSSKVTDFVQRKNYVDVRRRVVGHNIKIIFLSRDYTLQDGVILVADNIKSYISVSKCSVRVPIPKNEKQFQWLIKKLKWLGTEEGYKWAVSFNSEWITKYPSDLIDV